MHPGMGQPPPDPVAGALYEEINRLSAVCAAFREQLDYAQQDRHEKAGGLGHWRDCRISEPDEHRCGIVQKLFAGDAGKGWRSQEEIEALARELSSLGDKAELISEAAAWSASALKLRQLIARK